MKSFIGRLRRTVTLASSIALVSVAALAVSAPTASAVTIEVDYGNTNEVQGFYLCDAKVGNTYSMGCFNNNGDVLYVADWEADDRRVAVYWKLSDGSREGLCVSLQGPTWVPGQGWVGSRVACNKNMIEGKTILIKSGTCDGDVSSCTRPSQYSQWTAWDSTTV